MGRAPGAEAYFRRGSLPWLAVTAVSFGYYTWVIFWPQSIPYQSLGLLGSFTQYLVDHHHTLLYNGFWLAWLIHVGESLYAMVLCKKCFSTWTSFQWLLQPLSEISSWKHVVQPLTSQCWSTCYIFCCWHLEPLKSKDSNLKSYYPVL